MVSLKELVVVEGGTAAITSHFLQFSDPDSDDAHLTFTLATPPQLGQLELTSDPGMSQSFLSSIYIFYSKDLII